MRTLNMYRNWTKRALDLGCGIAAITVLSPVMLIVAACVRVGLGKPILFRQQRPGLDCRPFTCFKFRTMTDRRNPQGELLSERERLTPLGSWLRRTSLDELPQLWNVIRGDVSIVGPRPLLKEFLPYYTTEENRRHTVRPGITGWAQVHGRNSVNFDKRLEMDVWYVDHLSFALDMRILLATVRLVFSAEGTDLIAYPPLHVQRRTQGNLASVSPEAKLLNGEDRGTLECELVTSASPGSTLSVTKLEHRMLAQKC